MQQREIAELDAVRPPLHVALGALEEPHPDRRLVPDEMLDRKVSGARGRREIIPFGDVGRVGALPELERLGELRTPPRRVGEGLEVGAAQRRAVDVAEAGVRVGPRGARDRVSRGDDRVLGPCHGDLRIEQALSLAR
jgi:hypothetical protein